MGRNRKRKRNQSARDAESLQVDLLTGAESVQGPDAAETHPADDPEPVASPETRPAAHVERAEGPGDRWAKAVGRSEPGRRKAPREKDVAGSADVAADPAAEATDPAAVLRAGTHDAHESARDHAAAVRPAGEPLARAKDLVQRGRIQEAIELYLGILTVNPSNLKAHNNLGVLFDEMKRYEAALEHLQAAERLAPENVEVLTNFASTLTSLARYEEAEAALRRAQKIDADDLQVHLAIGILYFRRGLYAQAELELRWVCARARTNGLAFYYRGEALNRLSRFDESEQALTHAAELLPSDPRPFYTLGHLYDRKHLAEEAGEMYRRARELQGQ
jgi:tetratricopeptide (TPR) repeat protein